MEDEIFKEIEIRGITYKVSNYGRVIGPRKEIKQRLNDDGYYIVTLGKLEEGRSSFFVARLVGMLFVDGYEEGKEINHKDFCRTNNYYKNLEWITHKENIDYTLENNYDIFCASKQGEKNGRARYTREQVDKMRELYASGMTKMEVVKYFYPDLNFKERKKKYSRIKDILDYKTWK